MLAVIGGTGITQWNELNVVQKKNIETPYGATSSPIIYAELDDKPILFLSRHGFSHAIPPHKVNYRANIWALKQAGANELLAINAVGGITRNAFPGALVLPDQIIDYSYGREHTFFADNIEQVVHIDFSQPYSEKLRQKIIQAAKQRELDIQIKATYACTQGPRLESCAEITRLEKDGCDIVGMTGMPEAALARELELNYASLSVVANWAAGKSEHPITMEQIAEVLATAMDKVKRIITTTLLLK